MRKVTILTLFIFLLPSFSAGATIRLTPAEIITAINAYRAENNLHPLETESTLTTIAQGQSDYQASIQSLTHSGPGGTTSNGRAIAAGYGDGQTIFVDEIIYSGSTATTASAIAWWKSSSIHNNIMLSPEYHQIGAGQASNGGRTYFTVVVGRIPGVTSPMELQTEPPVSEVAIDAQASEVPTEIPESTAVQTEAPAAEQATPPPEISSETPAEEGINIPSWVIVLSVIILIVLIVGGVVYLRNKADSEDEEDVDFGEGGQVAVPPPRSKPELNKAFSELSHAKRFILLEHVAEKALESYDLSIVSIKPLQYRLNASFLVEALPSSDQSYDTQNYLLRVNSPNAHTQAEIHSEMQWLQAIHKETDLKVPEPLETKRGDLVTSIDLPNISRPRNCVVLHWQEGRALYEILTPEMLQRVGGFMARLHNQAANFKPPFRFKRQSWDLKGLTNENLDIPEEQARAGLTSKQLDVIDATKVKVMGAMQRLGGGPDVYGLIHADFHQRNYLFHHGEVRAIDFDTCGWGYYMYDLAVTLTTLLDHEEFSEMKAELLSGYTKFRELHQDHENLLTTFAAARLMTHTLLLAGHKDDPFFRDTAQKIVDNQIRMIARLTSLE